MKEPQQSVGMWILVSIVLLIVIAMICKTIFVLEAWSNEGFK